MNIKLVLAIFSFFTGAFLMFGLVLPFLFSAKSDLAVAGGWVLLVASVVFIGWVIVKAAKSLGERFKFLDE